VAVEQLESIKNKNRYHIYFILATPKITIENISVNEKGVSFRLVKHLGKRDDYFDFEDIDILGMGMNYNYAEISTCYPYSKLKISFNKDYLKQFYENNIKGKININKSEILQYKNLSIDCNRILDFMNERSSKTKEMEVLYVGQAYGKRGKRDALDRLHSHEKLQKILIDCNSKYPHKRIYILLLEMSTQLFSGFNGISKEFMCSEEESEEHLKKVISDLPKEKQVINITEAAIINYFKPKYNINFVDNFPSVKHKGYGQYYDLDYNCINIELDMEFYGMPYLQLYTPNNRLRNYYEAITYELFNDPNRSNMYDIFDNRK
jgi:hypothetical protein